ncbi:transcriptional regulator, AfsR/DnrI/RedD family [Deinococcus aerius]|uniref:Transcriptional regulator, AfsR/DnrI/RedD family n=1 Tax=Deinococcus aerius TaxID=200253 RepID=A0A2I9CVR7_9DEIO|nr:BTAD domain-containing putative transcriptional regulator [Deinococcus aerius]GBF06032.1 transcriptional regulator, AfsR/DnrI/RedD family [Deinococcus aerius]
MSTPPPWELLVLGTPRLVAPDGREWRPERKTLALLTYLALEGPAPRSRLAALLWPGTPGAGARNNLVHLLRRLTRLCGEELVRGRDVLALIPGVTVDVRDLLEEGGEAAPAGELLGSLDFDDLPDLADWVAAWREELDARRRAALARAATRSEERGEWAEALRAAGRLLDLDPLSEEAWRRVMRLHYLSGDRPAALRAYQRCQEGLERELGLTPEAETQALARLIDRGEPLHGAAQAPLRTLPLAVLRPPVLVGRERAWAQMEAAWAAGKTIYVTGDAGVGKTRFAQDFVGSKGRALYLPGHAGAEHVPFAAAAHNIRARLNAAPHVELPGWVRRELSRLLPEFRGGEEPAPIDSEATRLNYFLAHLEVVRLTAPGFAAVITDDVQYYDPATVELGAFFLTQSFPMGTPGEVPRHVIIYRRGTLPPGTQRHIDGLVTAGLAARIDVEPLDGPAVAALLDELNVAPGAASPSLPGELHDLTGGNPQFLLEALRHMFQTGEFAVDDALRSRAGGAAPLVAERLARLSPVALQAARGAAVLRDGFTLELLAEVLGTGLFELASAWEELEGAQIVSGERFSHDLVREAVTAGMSPTVRTLLHRASARVLARHAAHPGRVARHWIEAGDPRQAAPWLMAAGQAAEQTLRPGEAADFYASAARAYAESGDREGEQAARLAREAVPGRVGSGA